ncbi:MAG: ABC transporter ATP-binding protein [Deltaproteobacteria bacterium]|nr:ABC transporter ATP-binding protein [Deltaproteobacteria bacterium]
MDNILEIRELVKNFGGVMATARVSFDVSRGSRLGIIGPNGAGKTTIFNQITGEIKPTSGSIRFEGEVIHALKPHQISQKGIGRTFQLTRVFSELSVYENVLMGAVSRKLHYSPSTEQKQETEQILAWTKLDAFRDIKTKHLTVAKKKLVGMATALATRPKLLLLDEVMAGLTFVEIDEVLELLRKINEEKGITLIVVEHVMKVVMELSERIIVIASGEKIAEGPPGEIVRNQKVIDVYLGEEAH